MRRKKLSREDKENRRIRSKLLRTYFYERFILAVIHHIRNKCYSIKRKIKRNSLVILGVLLLLLIIGGIIYVILLMQQEQQQEGMLSNAIQIICAIITSVVTVYGIAWTLHAQSTGQREEHRLTIRPYIVFGREAKDSIVCPELEMKLHGYNEEIPFLKKNIQEMTVEQMGDYEWVCLCDHAYIHVADYAEGILDSIIVEDERYFLEFPILLRKGTTYFLDFSKYCFKMEKYNRLPDIFLCISDMMDNSYYYSLEMEYVRQHIPKYNLFNNAGLKIGWSEFTITGVYGFKDSYSTIVEKKEQDMERTPILMHWNDMKRFIFHNKSLGDELLEKHQRFMERRKMDEDLIPKP